MEDVVVAVVVIVAIDAGFQGAGEDVVVAVVVVVAIDAVSQGAVEDGTRGQCRDDNDCVPWAPSCSPLGYCR